MLIAFLIIASPMTVASHTASSAPLPYQMVLPNGYYQPFQVDAPAIPTTISVSMDSNTSIGTAIMTTSQFNDFNNGASDISNAIYYSDSASVQKSISVAEGMYYLVFYANAYTANVSYNIQTFPISPYLSYPMTSPEPTGISSFGLYNQSGSVSFYTVASSDVVGAAEIGSLQAYNATAPALNDTVSGATLQLNSLLVINENGGAQQVYWVQNTPDFVTSTSVVSWADNIWNASVSGLLTNSTITSTDGGYAYSFNNFGTTGYYYSFQSSNSTYRLPLLLALVVSETTLPGVGVTVQVGVQVMGNGSASAATIDWFDQATIHDPSVQSAYFYVSGNATAPNGLFYATELVFGGQGNGEATSFTQLSASLGLFYGNSTSGPQTAFPSYYTFGGNTGETADNLQVSYLQDGFASVFAGTPNYVYLGTASGTFSLPSAGTKVSVPYVSQTGATTQSSSSGSASPIPSYEVAGALIAGFVLVAFIVVMSRRGKGGTLPEAQVPMQPVTRFCHNCGNPIDPAMSFCPRCGAQQLPDEPGHSGEGVNPWSAQTDANV